MGDAVSDDLLGRIQVALDAAAPALGLPPGGLTAVEFDGGLVSVRMSEACASCPATIGPMMAMLEAELSRAVPGAEFVEFVV